MLRLGGIGDGYNSPTPQTTGLRSKRNKPKMKPKMKRIYTIIYTWHGERHRSHKTYETFADAGKALALFRFEGWNSWIESSYEWIKN